MILTHVDCRPARYARPGALRRFSRDHACSTMTRNSASTCMGACSTTWIPLPGPGKYPSLGAMGLNDQISSIRPLERYGRGEERQNGITSVAAERLWPASEGKRECLMMSARGQAGRGQSEGGDLTGDATRSNCPYGHRRQVRLYANSLSPRPVRSDQLRLHHTAARVGRTLRWARVYRGGPRSLHLESALPFVWDQKSKRGESGAVDAYR